MLCGDGIGRRGPELAGPFGLVGTLFAEGRYRYLMVVCNEYPSGPSRSEGQAREANDRYCEPRDGIATMGPSATADTGRNATSRGLPIAHCPSRTSYVGLPELARNRSV